VRLDRVLVGVDFTEAAGAAAVWTASHLAPGAEIALLYVVDVPAPPSFLRGRLPPREQLLETARLGALQRLRELGSAVPANRVWTEVRVGRAADQLIAAVRELDADLVVVGEHSPRAGLWATGTSTAERLLGHVSVPLLLARGLPHGPPRHLLLPLEESTATPRIVECGQLLAERTGAHITALHVMSANLYGEVRLAVGVLEGQDPMDRAVPAVHEWLRSELRAAGVAEERSTTRVALGDPAQEILAASIRHEADLIVMGSRQTKSIGSRLSGSVARAVLRDALIPVLVAPETLQR
jgi:universal stress protein F